MDETKEKTALRESQEVGLNGIVEYELGILRFKSKSQPKFHKGYMLPLLVTEQLEFSQSCIRAICSHGDHVPSAMLNLNSPIKSSIDVTTQLQTKTDKTVETFTLGDLWEVYDEWSAYGRGVPVMVKNSNKKVNFAVQYYVPYLSAIQIYINKPEHLIRGPGDEVDVLLSNGSESDDPPSRTSTDSSKGWEDIPSDSSNDQDAPWASRDPRGQLYFEYFERISPYTRVPFVDKMVEFAPKFPGLFTLRNTDLAPGSWISIAWYPIYCMPAMGHGRDLSACFLSFHTLSAFFQDENLAISGDVLDIGEMLGGKSKKEGLNSLRPFGLATYKLEEHFWLKDADDCEKVLHLYSAADSWLKQLSVEHHHDFNFFASRSPLAVISAP